MNLANLEQCVERLEKLVDEIDRVLAKHLSALLAGPFPTMWGVVHDQTPMVNR